MNLSTTSKKGRGLLATLCLAAGIALAVCGCTGREPGAGSGSAPAEAEDTWQVQVGVSAEGWDAATSSPVIVHIVSEEEGVDYYHAYAANEEAVALFLTGRIGFAAIPRLVASALDLTLPAGDTAEAVLEADRHVREIVRAAV